MEERDYSLGFVRLGFVLVAAGIVASCFVVSTLQAAYSPLALALPSAPFEHLEAECWKLAAASFGFGLLWPKVTKGAPDRVIGRLFGAGALTKVIVLGFGASQGMMAMQAADPRVMAPRLFLVRVLANALLIASFAWAAARVARPPKTP